MGEAMIIVTNSDVELLMRRYDKNRDGKISFMEFIQEIIPSIKIY